MFHVFYDSPDMEMVSDTCALIQDDGETACLQLAGVVRWGLDLKLNNVSSS